MALKSFVLGPECAAIFSYLALVVFMFLVLSVCMFVGAVVGSVWVDVMCQASNTL